MPFGNELSMMSCTPFGYRISTWYVRCTVHTSPVMNSAVASMLVGPLSSMPMPQCAMSM